MGIVSADRLVREQQRHYFVKAPNSVARLAGRCARKGCGRPPEHDVHLRPPGDDPQAGVIEQKAARG